MKRRIPLLRFWEVRVIVEAMIAHWTVEKQQWMALNFDEIIKQKKHIFQYLPQAGIERCVFSVRTRRWRGFSGIEQMAARKF
jgi:hypothetical protein